MKNMTVARLIVVISSLAFQSCYEKYVALPGREIAATDLFFAEGTVNDTLEISPSWKSNTKSVYMTAQELELFDNGTCMGSVIDSVEIDPNQQSMKLPIMSNGTYSYRIRSHFKSGNSLASPCSSPIIVAADPTFNFIMPPTTVDNSNVTALNISGSCSDMGSTFTVAAPASFLVSPVSCTGGIWNASVDMSGFSDGAGVLVVTATSGTKSYSQNLNFTKATAPTDPYWAQTVALLRCDTSSIADMKGRTFSNQNVTTSSAQKKFGNESCFFIDTGGSGQGGSNGSMLDYGSHADFAMGTGDFTAEAWIYPVYKDYRGVISTAPRICGQTDGFGLLDGTAFVGEAQGCSYSPVNNTYGQNDAPAVNQWSHVALVRSGTSLNYYVNGVLVGTGTTSINAANGHMIIGRLTNNQNSYYFSGYMQEVRLTKGVARYTVPFTPPTDVFPTQ